MKLTRISFRKAKEHECPAIKVGERYKYIAVMDDGRMAIGSFERQWYGLNFDGFYDTGLQFDAPGYNNSSWKKLYKISKC